MRFFLLLFLVACPEPIEATAKTPDTPASKAADTPSGPVATWSQGEITASQLDEGLQTELLKLEAEFVSNRYDARQQGLDAMVSEKILEAEAVKRGLADVTALLEAEVDAKLSPPTEEEVTQFYTMMARRMGGRPLEEVRPRILQEIARRSQAERFQAFLGEMRTAYKVKIALPRPEVVPAAVAANCAGAQDNYWGMFDALMGNQRALTEADLTRYATDIGLDLEKWNICRKDPAQEAEVQKDFEDGSKAGVQGTPAFFINGIFLNGAVPLEQFTAIIDAELAE
jgi:hypothetical protein